MEQHVASVAALVRRASAKTAEAGHWVEACGPGRLEEQVLGVLAAGGVADCGARSALVEAAARRQQRLLAEKRAKRKDRFQNGVERAMDQPPPSQEDDEVSSRGRRRRQSLDVGQEGAPGQAKAGRRRRSSVGLAPAPDQTGSVAVDTPAPSSARIARGTACDSDTREWTEVKAFKTQEEALQFVMECQPFDYRPVDLPEHLSRPEGTREAFETAKAMDPWPTEFTCLHGGRRRRLRIRKKEELLEEVMHKEQATKSVLSAFKSHRNAQRDSKRDSSRLHKEISAWVVEASGALFEPGETALRSQQKDQPDPSVTRYYVAMAAEAEERVIAEGFQVRKRTTIPCFGAPQEAVEAFLRHSTRAGGGEAPQASAPPTPRVLAVEIPPELGVAVAPHSRGSGFVIHARALPAGCFRRVAWPAAGAPPSAPPAAAPPAAAAAAAGLATAPPVD